ncbi:MAG: hypothetical protein ACOZFS_02415 [Thermodesulfobacteriota bacterium]
MSMVACVFIFFMGGVAALTIMHLLFFFWGRSFKKTEDEQYLQRIANILQCPSLGDQK